MAGPSTGALINNLSYTHDAMVDLILAQPMISQGEIARHFGYTESWVSLVVRSDSFREGLAARKGELMDPILKAHLDERINALAHRSIDVLMEQLDMKANPDIALKALELSTRAKGYGAGVNVNVNNFVVAMPQKAVDSDSWAAAHKPQQPVFRPGALPTITIDSPIPDLNAA